jgi:hypothetical protein
MILNTYLVYIYIYIYIYHRGTFIYQIYLFIFSYPEIEDGTFIRILLRIDETK